MIFQFRVIARVSDTFARARINISSEMSAVTSLRNFRNVVPRALLALASRARESAGASIWCDCFARV